MLQHIRKFCAIVGGDGEGEHQNGSVVGDKKTGTAVWNMADWFGYLTYDVMGELCFGKTFGMLVDCGKRGVIALVDRAAFRHYVVSFLISPPKRI